MGGQKWEEGTIQEYLRRFWEDKFELVFYPIAVSKSETKNIRGLKGGRYRKYRIRGVAKKLFRFVALHRERGYPNSTESYRMIVMNNNFEKLCERCDLSFLSFYKNMMNFREKLLLNLENEAV